MGKNLLVLFLFLVLIPSRFSLNVPFKIINKKLYQKTFARPVFSSSRFRLSSSLVSNLNEISTETNIENVVNNSNLSDNSTNIAPATPLDLSNFVFDNYASKHDVRLQGPVCDLPKKKSKKKKNNENISDVQIINDELFEEVNIYGMSPSPDGFYVILKYEAKIPIEEKEKSSSSTSDQNVLSENEQEIKEDRYILLCVSPSDPLINGLDRHDDALSPESVTLLQLFQNIDMEGLLHPLALQKSCIQAILSDQLVDYTFNSPDENPDEINSPSSNTLKTPIAGNLTTAEENTLSNIETINVGKIEESKIIDTNNQTSVDDIVENESEEEDSEEEDIQMKKDIENIKKFLNLNANFNNFNNLSIYKKSFSLAEVKILSSKKEGFLGLFSVNILNKEKIIGNIKFYVKNPFKFIALGLRYKVPSFSILKSLVSNFDSCSYDELLHAYPSILKLN